MPVGTKRLSSAFVSLLVLLAIGGCKTTENLSDGQQAGGDALIASDTEMYVNEDSTNDTQGANDARDIDLPYYPKAATCSPDSPNVVSPGVTEYTPDWFGTAEGYRQRLAFGMGACAVAKSGSLYCSFDAEAAPEGQSQSTDLLENVLVRVPIVGVVDVSTTEFELSSPIAVDTRGDAWWWFECCFGDPSPPYPVIPDYQPGIPAVLDLGGTVLQTAITQSALWGGAPSVLARVKPGIIVGISKYGLPLGRLPKDMKSVDEHYDGMLPYENVVPGVSDFVQLRRADSFFCAVRRNRTVMCWGLVDGGAPFSIDTCGLSGPVVVPELDGTVDLSLSALASCAVKSDGSLWCWGIADDGGDYDFQCRADVRTPTQVPCVKDARQVAMSAFGFRCVVLANNDVNCYHTGHAGWRAFYTPTEYYPLTWPGAKVPGLSEPIVEVATYFDCACALTESDALYCWGDLGDCFWSVWDGEWTDTPVLVTHLR